MPGRAYTDFGRSVSLHLFPTDKGDPLYALRRYLCLRPNRDVGPPLAPPLLEGEFVPEPDEDVLIISEPWEDAPSFFEIVIAETWNYASTYTQALQYSETWSDDPFPVLAWSEPWDYTTGLAQNPSAWSEPWNYSAGFAINPSEWGDPWSYSVGLSGTLSWAETWAADFSLSGILAWLDNWELNASLSTVQSWLEQWEG